MRNSILSLLLSLIFISTTFAQSSFIRGYGGPANEDRFLHAIEALNGGYFYVGLTRSLGKGDRNGVLMKTNTDGDVLWTTAFGSDFTDEYFHAIWQAPDSSLYLFGHQNHPNKHDVMLLAKFTPTGNIVWHKLIGGMFPNYDEQARAIIGMGGHLYLFGSTQGNPALGLEDSYLLKYDLSGNKVWANGHGENGRESLREAIHSINGNFKGVGYTNSIGAGDMDFMVTEADSNGNVFPMKSYGTSAYEVAEAIIELGDGTTMIGGYRIVNGDQDYFIIRLDTSDNVMWAKSYGGTGEDRCYRLCQLPTGNIACVGSSSSFGTGDLDAFTLIINPQGQIVKGTTYGGTNDETIFHAFVTKDQSLLSTGWSNSPAYSHGQEDFLAIKEGIYGFNSQVCAYQPVTSEVQSTDIPTTTASGGWQYPSHQELPLFPQNIPAFPMDKTICLNTTAINSDIPATQVTLFPDPAIQILNIELPYNIQGLQYDIFNATGQVVLRGSKDRPLDRFSVEIAQLTSGFYVVQVSTQKGDIWTGKWIKQ